MTRNAQHLKFIIQHIERCCWWGAQALISVLLPGTNAATSAGPAAGASDSLFLVSMSCCSWTEERKLTFLKPEKQDMQFTNCEKSYQATL